MCVITVIAQYTLDIGPMSVHCWSTFYIWSRILACLYRCVGVFWWCLHWDSFTNTRADGHYRRAPTDIIRVKWKIITLLKYYPLCVFKLFIHRVWLILRTFSWNIIYFVTAGNFHPLEVVSRCRDTQLQVGENYSHLINLRANNCKSWCLNTQFVPENCDLNG